MKNKLLHIFGVSSHEELIEYINNNPTDKRVIEMKELLELFEVDIENKE